MSRELTHHTRVEVCGGGGKSVTFTDWTGDHLSPPPGRPDLVGWKFSEQKMKGTNNSLTLTLTLTSGVKHFEPRQL